MELPCGVFGRVAISGCSDAADFGCCAGDGVREQPSSNTMLVMQTHASRVAAVMQREVSRDWLERIISAVLFRVACCADGWIESRTRDRQPGLLELRETQPRRVPPLCGARCA